VQWSLSTHKTSFLPKSQNSCRLGAQHRIMKRLMVWLFWGGLLSQTLLLHSAELHVNSQGTDLLLHVLGDPNPDWRVQTSSNLTVWTDLSAFGTLLADPVNPLARSAGPATEKQLFYRAVQTDGLFDR